MNAQSTKDTTPRDGRCEMWSGPEEDPATHERCKKVARFEAWDDEGDRHLLCGGHVELVRHVFENVRPLLTKGDSRG